MRGKHLPEVILTIIIVGFVSTGLALFGGGSGTFADPWLIERAEHLDNIRNYLGSTHNNKNFLQTADIDLGAAPWNEGMGWEPIGSSWPASQRFHGNYDGGFYTISNLTINRGGLGYPDGEIMGLFGCLENGSLRRIVLENINVSGEWFVAGLVGQVTNGTATISDCIVGGQINATDQYVGGITGAHQGRIIENCYTYGTINGSAFRVGGIVGFNEGAVNNSYSAMSVTTSSPNLGIAGGLVGSNQQSGTITRSYSIGRIDTPEGAGSVGGLVGSNSGSINESYWDTVASNQSHSAGGYPRTTDQMRYPYDGDTFVGWFEDYIWLRDVGRINDGYPLLYYQEDEEETLDTPQVHISLTTIDGTDFVFIGWEPVESANSYWIYASDDPNVVHWGEAIDIVAATEFSEPVIAEENMAYGKARFYTVVAKADEVP